jgi:hypothetical protein
VKTTTKPQKGDIGVIGAREVRDSTGTVEIKMGQNHHFIVTDVGTILSTASTGTRA